MGKINNLNNGEDQTTLLKENRLMIHLCLSGNILKSAPPPGGGCWGWLVFEAKGKMFTLLSVM